MRICYADQSLIGHIKFSCPPLQFAKQKNGITHKSDRPPLSTIGRSVSIYTQRPQSRSMAVRRNDNLVIDATAIFIMRSSITDQEKELREDGHKGYHTIRISR